MSYIIDAVTKVTLKDLFDEAKEVYDSIWEQARGEGIDPKIYQHWTAGRYGQFWSPYHIQIDKDGSIYRNDLLDLDDVSEGTWLRNTGSISVTALCGFDTTTNFSGTNPLTADQLESLATVTNVLADALDLTIDIKHVLTHGEAADNEDGWEAHEEYGPKTDCERWDLEVLWLDKSQVFDPWDEGNRGGDVIRGKANWYRQTYGVGGIANGVKLA